MTRLKVSSLVANRFFSWLGGQRYLTMQFDITNACNLSCSHCYHANHSNLGSLKLDQWESILDQYNEVLNTLYLQPCVVICGGEPLTSPLLFPFISSVRSRWPSARVFVLSNGTLITESVAKKFRDLDVSVQVSLDGSRAETHDLIRGAGRFDKTIEAVKILRSQHVKVILQAVLCRSLVSEIRDFFYLARELNASAMNFTRFVPFGFGKSYNKVDRNEVLMGDDLKSAFEEIIKSSNELRVQTNTDQPLFHLVDASLGASGKFGFQGMVVDYKGNFKVSSRVPHTLGNLFEVSMIEVFLNHPVVRDLRNARKSECAQCEFYKRCGGNRNLSFATSGSFLTKDPGCWHTLIKKETEGIKNEVG